MNNAKKDEAYQFILEKLSASSIPDETKHGVASLMVVDFINNVEGKNSVNQMTIEHMKDALGDKFTAIKDKDVQIILDAFKSFINKYYMEGGRRKKGRKTRKQKKRSKKTRRA